MKEEPETKKERGWGWSTLGALENAKKKGRKKDPKGTS